MCKQEWCISREIDGTYPFALEPYACQPGTNEPALIAFHAYGEPLRTPIKDVDLQVAPELSPDLLHELGKTLATYAYASTPSNIFSSVEQVLAHVLHCPQRYGFPSMSVNGTDLFHLSNNTKRVIVKFLKKVADSNVIVGRLFQALANLQDTGNKDDATTLTCY